MKAIRNSKSTEIKPLEKWHGSDVSNEVSLFEYGLLFRKTNQGLQVIYKTGENMYSFGWFDPFYFYPGNSLLDLEPVFASCDSTIEDYLNNMELFCTDLVWYYGPENVFGTDYTGGYSELEIRKKLKRAIR